ncbi:MAG: hypothetical protein KH181_07845 [Subdoligranulum variabile]|nr:hypothetical protein [Subdoligranulum variabile]
MLHITYNYALQTLCGAPHNVCKDGNKLVEVLKGYVKTAQKSRGDADG